VPYPTQIRGEIHKYAQSLIDRFFQGYDSTYSMFCAGYFQIAPAVANVCSAAAYIKNTEAWTNYNQTETTSIMRPSTKIEVNGLFKITSKCIGYIPL